MIWMLLVSIGFAVGRFLVPVKGLDLTVGGVYKSLAHVWVGFCFGAAIADLELAFIPICLTVVEIVAAIVRKK